ncbi:hypothetical protein [Streptomyces sp. NPDC056308]|uniref:hypothetical protein n=1 Tax=unclassified Streptomyces TaxID=2593676 RepID=UPI0035D89FE8
MAPVVLPAPRPAALAAAPEPEPVDVDHQVLHDHIERYGKHSADSSRTAEPARDRWFD